jgi:hypothetical protein
MYVKDLTKPPANYRPGSPYCSDPNCAYCKELREAFKQEVRMQSSNEDSAALGIQAMTQHGKESKRER